MVEGKKHEKIVCKIRKSLKVEQARPDLDPEYIDPREYYPDTYEGKPEDWWGTKDFKPDVVVKRKDKNGKEKIDIFEVWATQTYWKSIEEFIWVNRVKNLGNYYIILTGEKLNNPEFWYTIRDFIFCDFIRPKYLSLPQVHFIEVEKDKGFAKIKRIYAQS